MIEQSQPNPNPSPELESLAKEFVEGIRKQILPDDSIMERATPRWERRKCRNGKAGWFSNCQYCRHGGYCQGPYLYLYWKEKGKLKKKYLGKNPDEFLTRKLEKCYSHFSCLGNR